MLGRARACSGVLGTRAVRCVTVARGKAAKNAKNAKQKDRGDTRAGEVGLFAELDLGEHQPFDHLFLAFLAFLAALNLEHARAVSGCCEGTAFDLRWHADTEPDSVFPRDLLGIVRVAVG